MTGDRGCRIFLLFSYPYIRVTSFLAGLAQASSACHLAAAMSWLPQVRLPSITQTLEKIHYHLTTSRHFNQYEEHDEGAPFIPPGEYRFSVKAGPYPSRNLVDSPSTLHRLLTNVRRRHFEVPWHPRHSKRQGSIRKDEGR